VNKSVHLISLGCPKNLVDSEVILAGLSSEGFRPVDQTEKAGIIVINTCCFIDEAKQESIDTILEHVRLKEHDCETLVVCGCLVQRYGKRLVTLLPEVDLFVGIARMRQLGKILRQFLALAPGKRERIFSIQTSVRAWDEPAPRLLSTPQHYAYVKIADGCSHRCTFCIIPAIRGPYRSRPTADILSEAQGLAENGVREIILVAQDTGGYGTDREETNFLPDLIKTLAKIDGLEWIRILYIHPFRLDPKLLQTIREEPKCCPYLDIPIQHVSPGVLRRMGREGGDVRDKLERVRLLLPDAHIRTSLLVGFPGETDDEFDELLKFVKEFRFESLGVFTYSREEGTPAAKMKPQVHHLTRKQRRRRLMEVQARIVEEKNQHRIGKVFDVMVDGFDDADPRNLIGRTFFQTPDIDGTVLIPGGAPSHIGRRVKVKIIGSNLYDLIGQVQPSSCHSSRYTRRDFFDEGHLPVSDRDQLFS